MILTKTSREKLYNFSFISETCVEIKPMVIYLYLSFSVCKAFLALENLIMSVITAVCVLFLGLLYIVVAIDLTNRFHIAVRLFSNRSQMTSKCGKNKKVAHEAEPSVSLMFLPYFDLFCDLLLNQTHGTMESICFI